VGGSDRLLSGWVGAEVGVKLMDEDEIEHRVRTIDLILQNHLKIQDFYGELVRHQHSALQGLPRVSAPSAGPAEEDEEAGDDWLDDAQYWWRLPDEVDDRGNVLLGARDRGPSNWSRRLSAREEDAYYIWKRRVQEAIDVGLIVDDMQEYKDYYCKFRGKYEPFASKDHSVALHVAWLRTSGHLFPERLTYYDLDLLEEYAPGDHAAIRRIDEAIARHAVEHGSFAAHYPQPVPALDLYATNSSDPSSVVDGAPRGKDFTKRRKDDGLQQVIGAGQAQDRSVKEVAMVIDERVREWLDATRAVLHQEGAAYSGSRPLGTTWAVITAVYRDSPEADQEWLLDLEVEGEAMFPGKTCVERFNHWAFGWVDYLMAEVLDEFGEPTLTAAWLMSAGVDKPRGQ